VGHPLESALHYTSELRLVRSIEISGLAIERIVGIWLIEEIYQSVYHCVDIEHRLPVFAKNVETNGSF
jgi:hypothetical protein